MERLSCDALLVLSSFLRLKALTRLRTCTKRLYQVTCAHAHRSLWKQVRREDDMLLLLSRRRMNVHGARMLHSILVFEARHVTYNRCQSLRNACERGDFELIVWLCQTFKLQHHHAREASVLATTFCLNRLDIAEWLVNFFDLYAYDARTEGGDEGQEETDDDYHQRNWLLREACKEGWLERAQWLVNTFGLNPSDVRVKNDACLLSACYNDHLDMVQWIIEQFDLENDENYENRDHLMLRALGEACENDNQDVARWLTETALLTREAVGHSDVWWNVCRAGNVKIAKVLHETLDFRPLAHDDKDWLERSFECALTGPMNLHMIKWIVKTFQYQDINRSVYLSELRKRCQLSRFTEAVFLLEQFGLTPDEMATWDCPSNLRLYRPKNAVPSTLRWLCALPL